MVLSSLLPCPRQRIPGITLGICFLDDPTVPRTCSWRLLRDRPHGECGVVTSFLRSVLRSRRAVLSTGFSGSEYRSVRLPPAPSLSRFGQANNPRRLGRSNDGFRRTFACAAHSYPLPRTCRSGSGGARFSSPLHGLRTSRYRGGDAFRCSPQRWGIGSVSHTPHRTSSCLGRECPVLAPHPPVAVRPPVSGKRIARRRDLQ
jgi:hypothetical protein